MSMRATVLARPAGGTAAARGCWTSCSCPQPPPPGPFALPFSLCASLAGAPVFKLLQLLSFWDPFEVVAQCDWPRVPLPLRREERSLVLMDIVCLASHI